MTTARRSTRAWAIAIVIITLAGGVVGAVVSRDIAPSYVATATMLVGDLDRPDLATDFETSAMVAAIYGGLVRSESVLRPVISRLDLPTDWQELRDRVHVDLGMNEIPIITLTVYAGSTAEATATASAITHRLLELSQPAIAGLPLNEEPSVAGRSTRVQRVISKVEEGLVRLESKAASLSASDRVRLQQRIDRQSGLLMSWQEIYGAQLTATAGSANDLRLLQPAQPKGGKVRPLTAVNVGLGALIGCLLGFGLVLGAAMRRSFAPTSGLRGEHGSTVLPDADVHDTAHSSARVSGSVDDPWARELARSYQET